MLESERILLHADFKITRKDRYIEKNHVTRNMRGLETVYVAKKKRFTYTKPSVGRAARFMVVVLY